MQTRDTSLMTRTIAERRHLIRVDAEFPVHYRAVASTVFRETRTKDFSQGGLRCPVHDVLPLGTRMNLELALEGDRMTTFTGEVVWCRRLRPETADGLRGYQAEIGLRFSTDVVLQAYAARLRSTVTRHPLPLPKLEPDGVVSPDARNRVRERIECLAQVTFRSRWKHELTADQRTDLVSSLTDELLGWGPIEAFLRDSSVSEIMVNGPFQIFIERHGRLERASASFRDQEHLMAVIERILSTVKRRLSIAEPSMMTGLPDGSRIHITIPPVAPDGPYVSIRKRSHDVLTLDGLVRAGTLTDGAATLLRACVQGRLNLVLSGTASSGKTTMLNALAAEIPTQERIICIEEFPELQLAGQHVVRFEARPPSIEGRWAMTMPQLLHQALHMRPDRVIVGELGGPGALEMLDAMHAGQEGLLTSFHAHSPADALHRLATLALMANSALSLTALERQIRSSIDLIVQLERFHDGRRRVTRISEVRPGADALPVDLLTLAGDQLQSTHVRPDFLDRLTHRGVAVDQLLRASASPSAWD